MSKSINPATSTLFRQVEIEDDKPLSKPQVESIEKVGEEVKEIRGYVTDNADALKHKLRVFNSILNRQPLQRMVRSYQGYLYLPIRYHKMLFQQLFLGQTKDEVIRYDNIFNEITVHVRNHYLHPVTGVWLFVDGLGSSQIMQDAGTKVADFALFKKPNALQTCLPKARSEAFKNGTSQLGPIFGSDLNRKLLEGEGNYDALSHTVKPINQ